MRERISGQHAGLLFLTSANEADGFVLATTPGAQPFPAMSPLKAAESIYQRYRIAWLPRESTTLMPGR